MSKYQGQDTRGRILEAAFELFTEELFNNVTIDNENYQYYIYLEYDTHGHMGFLISWFGCRIKYTVDTINP